jgi:hypothetical protein
VAQATGHFSAVHIADDPRGVRISAHRHSNLKCTDDPDFYLVVAKGPDGQLGVLEERSETWAISQCALGEGKTLAQRMDELIQASAEFMPMTLDEDTRLDRITRQGQQLHYAITLTRVAKGELDFEALGRDLREQERARLCVSPHLQAILEARGQIVYEYSTLAGERLIRFDFWPGTCSGG